MMTRRFLVFISLSVFFLSFAHGQSTGYYNGTEGLDGDDLKSALHYIISDHTPYTYYSSKYIFQYSDADPNNPNNLIQVYTGRSHPNDDFGNGGDALNREHVWAKSHGNFNEVEPMYNDVHNLKPADASVNQSKGNKDFDEGGIQHPEATGCYYTTYTWEPRDAVKGDIARIILYMSVRYEGDNGEIDLEAVDKINTYPDPEHGKLSTLLEWNLQDPPDDFEMNRNNVIAGYQGNRNPFIDEPLFAQMIWAGESASPIRISDISMFPDVVQEDQEVRITSGIFSTQGDIYHSVVYWGLDRNDLNQQVTMINNGGRFEAIITGQEGDNTVYYRIQAGDGFNSTSSVVYCYQVNAIFNGTMTSIYKIQGQQTYSPYQNQIVNTTGVVTANFGSKYFIQDGYGEWRGISVDDPARNPRVGDSIIITGKVTENDGLTEIKDISKYYLISRDNIVVEPVVINTGDSEESWESVLVKVKDAVCTNASYYQNDYMWKVNDGTGTLSVQNTDKFEYKPLLGETYAIKGPMSYTDGKWKIDLSGPEDVEVGIDTDPPVVLSVNALATSSIKVQFSEDLDQNTAEEITNYSVNSGISVSEATLSEVNKKLVYLTVSEMSTGTYQISFHNVEDLSGNVMESSTKQFSFSTGIYDHLGLNELKIFPVPISDHINITFESDHLIKSIFQLIDISGKTILENNYPIVPGKNHIRIDITDLNPGNYILLIRNSSGFITRKVIIY